jgi:hypothetical protein
MKSLAKFLAVTGMALYFSTSCFGATVSGTVKGPDGAPMQGVFVRARNTKTKMTFIVLSDQQGRYRVENLPEGDYQVQARATGFRAEPQNGVTLAADQNTSYDFTLASAPVRWNELSIYQAKKLWPDEKAKETVRTWRFQPGKRNGTPVPVRMQVEITFRLF